MTQRPAIIIGSVLLAILLKFAFAYPPDKEGTLRNLTFEECIPFDDWLPWSKNCVRWTSYPQIRNDYMDACQREYDNKGRTTPDLGFKMPQKCGHCSVKIRCRKRDTYGMKGCFPLEPETKVCHEFGDVCTLDKHAEFGCNWNMHTIALKNCIDRPQYEEYQRDALRKFADDMPDMNCFEKDGQCKCCCHPFKPNKEGTECVKVHEEPACDSLGEYNQWSKCLWYPLRNVTDEVRGHCHLGVHTNEVLLPKPTGLELPEPCGYCSFKVRCKTRRRQDGCFHIQSDKRNCGPKDCPTCGNVCTTPKVDGKCNWEAVVGKTSSHKEENIFTKFPYWRLRGINKLRELPRGICKEVNGQCKCCCHPFMPNEQGTECVYNDFCQYKTKTDEDSKKN